MNEEPTTGQQEQPAPEGALKKLSGAQRKKDTRTRIKNPKTGVLELGIFQSHARVLRGRQSETTLDIADGIRVTIKGGSQAFIDEMKKALIP